MTAHKKPEEKKQVGRKSAFKNKFIELVFKYALLGATDVEMAGFFGVSERTFNTWKRSYPEFLQSIKKGKAIADANVASKLYSRAIGYDYEEIHVEKKGRKVVSRKTLNKYMAPETTAQIFWLKNRQPDKWRDRIDNNISGDITLKSRLDDLSDEELMRIINNDPLSAQNDKERD
jgi:hypothetical protein